MALGVKKGSILLASLLFGTFGLHAIYRAQAQSPAAGSGGSAMTQLDTGEQGVHVTATVDRGAVLQKSDGLVHVEVSLTADALHGAPEPTPTDVLVILDHSGSMQGQKLEYAKQALLGLIDRVRPQDRLGVATFDGFASVLFPLEAPAGSARARWRALVNGISVGGGTNIRGGLEQGLGMLAERSLERVTRVMLLSDGQDTSGNSFQVLVGRARELGSKQAVLSTLGIGEDFDEQVMTGLASAGTGAFYYLSKLDVLPGMLDAELKTATETYASGVELRLHAGEGVKVTSAGGLPLERRGDEVIVPVGSLYAARERKVWLTLQVPTDGLSEHALGSLALAYRRAGESFEVRPAALPQLVCVASQEKFEKAIDPEVWGRAMLEEELTRAHEELGDAIARGTAHDVDNSVQRVEQQRALAERLGQSKVAAAVSEIAAAGVEAKAAQAAAAPVRNIAAKRAKAIGYGKRNASSYAGTDWQQGF